jgi:SAM-dependent methyltransferase
MLPFLTGEDGYIGIDVSTDVIDRCKRNFNHGSHKFIVHNVGNRMYRDQELAAQPWPFAAASANFLIAVSVWTHLAEKDFVFYLAEVARVLCDGGRAIITLFVIDERENQITSEMAEKPFFPGKRWVFDKPAYDSQVLFTTSWAKYPEIAIAVRENYLRETLESLRLRVLQVHTGYWSQTPGCYFQDIFILEKASPHA